MNRPQKFSFEPIQWNELEKTKEPAYQKRSKRDFSFEPVPLEKTQEHAFHSEKDFSLEPVPSERTQEHASQSEKDFSFELAMLKRTQVPAYRTEKNLSFEPIPLKKTPEHVFQQKKDSSVEFFPLKKTQKRAYQSEKDFPFEFTISEKTQVPAHLSEKDFPFESFPLKSTVEPAYQSKKDPSFELLSGWYTEVHESLAYKESNPFAQKDFGCEVSASKDPTSTLHEVLSLKNAQNTPSPPVQDTPPQVEPVGGVRRTPPPKGGGSDHSAGHPGQAGWETPPRLGGGLLENWVRPLERVGEEGRDTQPPASWNEASYDPASSQKKIRFGIALFIRLAWWYKEKVKMSDVATQGGGYVSDFQAFGKSEFSAIAAQGVGDFFDHVAHGKIEFSGSATQGGGCRTGKKMLCGPYRPEGGVVRALLPEGGAPAR